MSKDQASDHIFLRGTIKDDLYVLNHLYSVSPLDLVVIGEQTSGMLV